MSAPQKYRKRPVEITAVQWTGANAAELAEFMGASPVLVENSSEGQYVVLTTIHGETARARIGDWVVPEPQEGRFYPVRPDIFAATYEAVQAEEQWCQGCSAPFDAPDPTLLCPECAADNNDEVA